MITRKGYEKFMTLDSKRDIKVLLMLMQLGKDNGAVTITQAKLAELVHIKNQANINSSLANLIKKDCISKVFENKRITYLINPTLYLTCENYEDSLERYMSSKKKEASIHDDTDSVFDKTDFSILMQEFSNV